MSALIPLYLKKKKKSAAFYNGKIRYIAAENFSEPHLEV